MSSTTKVQFTSKEVNLKPLFDEDVSDNYVKWLNDPTVNQYLEIRHNLPITKENILEFIKNCKKIKRHHWGIFTKGKHVGNISCSAYSHVYSWVDISIIIGEEECRGIGLGKLSMAGAIDHLFLVSQFHRISAGAYSNNLPSIRLFSGLGFNCEGVLRENVLFGENYIDSVKLSILEHQWKQIKGNIPKAKVQRMPWE
jgi:[ribosomal protein S5]-alanine N-acetyltransferase